MFKIFCPTEFESLKVMLTVSMYQHTPAPTVFMPSQRFRRKWVFLLEMFRLPLEVCGVFYRNIVIKTIRTRMELCQVPKHSQHLEQDSNLLCHLQNLKIYYLTRLSFQFILLLFTKDPNSQIQILDENISVKPILFVRSVSRNWD